MLAPSARGNRCDSITLAFAALFALSGAVAVPAGTRDVPPQFTSGVNVVEVYASVVTTDGEPVRGLTREDFEILEDGVTQRLSAFTAGDFPLTVALAVDRSFSMEGRPLAAAKSAARTFLRALRPGDESLLVGIGSEVGLLAGPGGTRAEQLRAVDAMTPWGTTPLHDAIVAAIDAVDAGAGRRALVILSDGDDRYSTATAQDAITRARRSNVMVYPVALGRTRPPLFAEVATLTGGRSYHARELQGLDQVLGRIAAQLREQYLLGYSPARPAQGGTEEWRAITVRVKRPDLSVRARDGYFVR